MIIREAGKINKKIIGILIFILSFLLCILPSINAHTMLNIKDYSNNINNPKGVFKKWTFIGYLNGDASDSEKTDMLGYINEMELIGSTQDVNIVVQADDYQLWNNQTRRYYIEFDDDLDTIHSPIVDEDVGEKNMGDAVTFKDFVIWAVSKYPAESYCLILTGHGGGWRGISFDYTNKYDKLTMDELKEACTEIEKYIDKKIDLLILHSCTMGMLEVYYQLKDFFDICIASEELTSYDEFSLIGCLRNLTDNPFINSEDLARKIVDSSFNVVNDRYSHVFFGVKLNRIEELSRLVDSLSLFLLSDMPLRYKLNDVNSYSNCWNGLPAAAHPHDLYRLSERLSVLIKSNDIRVKCHELMSYINETVIRPIDEGLHYIDYHLYGISIYFPPKDKDYSSNYDLLDFANNTNWEEFLKAYYKKSINLEFFKMILF